MTNNEEFADQDQTDQLAATKVNRSATINATDYNERDTHADSRCIRYNR